MSHLESNVPSNTSPRQRFDHTITIYIWTNWECIPVNEVFSWQYVLNKRGDPADHVSSALLMKFLENSSTIGLHEKIDKKILTLPINQCGGFIYLYYLLTTLFTMTRDTKTGCNDFIA